MKRLAMTLVLASACHDGPAATHEGSSTGGSTSSSSSTTAASTSSGADTSTTMAPEPVVVFDATLDLELKETIHVTVSMVGDAVEVAIDPSRGYGLLTGSLQGVGRIDAYPEAEATIYTATFDGPAVDSGPCGDAPVSLGLALHHDADADVIAGGLTGYCGAATFFGVPAIEPLRISGRVP